MKILGVGDVGRYVRELLEGDDLLADLWVTGEITNLSRSGAGHYYFALKDDQGQLRSVLFRGAALRCGAEPRAGDAVVAHGKVAFYEPNGTCELCVDLLYPSGVGAAQLRFEALRLKLEEEGLFAPERKRALPAFPRRIGLLTSEGGAVVHDVLTVLARRYPLAEVVFAHTAVQGGHAPAEIAAGLARLRAWRAEDGGELDVAIVGRGGGSPEELAAFNDEEVARAVFASPWPIVSAIGHETDFTICDFVADVRAPTPSAAAEMIAPDLQVLEQDVRELAAAAVAAIERELASARDEARRLHERLLLRAPLAQIAQRRQACSDEVERAANGLAHRLARHREQLAARRLQLAALSPTATLARGYGIVSLATDRLDQTGRAIRSTSELGPGQEIEIRLLDGAVDATTTGVRLDRSDSRTPSPPSAPAGRNGATSSAGKADGTDPPARQRTAGSRGGKR